MRKTPQPMRSVLAPAFFDRPTLAVARDLLGKYLVRRIPAARKGGPARTIALMITEVEAYDGPHDRASHASRGMTPRTTVMFGPAGVFYVYFTYGLHWLVNVVAGPKGYPAAVLIRGGAYIDEDTGEVVRIKGPARLTRFLRVTGAENTLPAARTSGLWFEDRGVRIPRAKIAAVKRVGVDYAGHIWAAKPYNFQILPQSGSYGIKYPAKGARHAEKAKDKSAAHAHRAGDHGILKGLRPGKRPGISGGPQTGARRRRS